MEELSTDGVTSVMDADPQEAISPLTGAVSTVAWNRAGEDVRKALAQAGRTEGLEQGPLRGPPIPNICNSEIYMQTTLRDGPVLDILLKRQGIECSFFPFSKSGRFNIRSQ